MTPDRDVLIAGICHFVDLSACLFQGKGFFRVPILTASLQLYTPQTLGQATLTEITTCPYQISRVNHLCCGFVEQLPITHPASTNPSAPLIPVSQPVLFWR